MDIPELPPDISFERLPHTPEARDFAFEVKRAAMGPHIIVRWGWDEAFQRNFHEKRFRDTPFSRIMLKGQVIGTIALRLLPIVGVSMSSTCSQPISGRVWERGS
jgi:hypothetical protein